MVVGRSVGLCDRKGATPIPSKQGERDVRNRQWQQNAQGRQTESNILFSAMKRQQRQLRREFSSSFERELKVGMSSY